MFMPCIMYKIYEILLKVVKPFTCTKQYHLLQFPVSYDLSVFPNFKIWNPNFPKICDFR